MSRNLHYFTHMTSFLKNWQKRGFFSFFHTYTWNFIAENLRKMRIISYMKFHVISVTCGPSFITSRVSDAVEVIKSVSSVCVCICASVCLCVCQRSHCWTVGPMNLKFGVGMNLHNILDEFKGQGHRSKFKVTILKNVIFTWTYDLCVSIHHGKGTLGQRNFKTRVAGGASTLRRFHFKYESS